MPFSSLPPDIRAALLRFRRRVLWLRACWRLGITAAATAVLLGAAVLLDRYLILSVVERGFITSTTAIVIAVLLTASLLGLRPPRPLDLARGLEAEEPGLGEGLLTLVQFERLTERERSQFDPALLHSLGRSTGEILSQARTEGMERMLWPARLRPEALRARVALGCAVVLWGVLLVSALLHQESSRLLFARFLHPTSHLPRPTTVVLEVLPKTIAAARGADVEIVGKVLRGSPREAVIFTRKEGRAWVEHRQDLTSGNTSFFSKRLAVLRKSLEYRVSAGDFLSPTYQVRVREAPRAVSFRVTYKSPDYTRLPPRKVVQTTGDLTALEGTHVQVEIIASEALRGARMQLFEQTHADSLPRPTDTAAARVELPVELPVEGNAAKIESLEISSSGSYRVFLEATDGVTGGGRSLYIVRALADRSPVVEILDPKSAEVVAEESSLLDLRYRAEDDVAVVSIELVLEPASAESRLLTIPILPHGNSSPAEIENAARSVHASYQLDVSRLELGPGESADFFLRAVDGLHAKGESEKRTLRVAFAPDAPEGPGWPASLVRLQEKLGVLSREWSAVLPARKLHAAETSLTAEASLAAMAFLRRVAADATETGRSIAVPSPNRRALENIGRLLRQTAADEGWSFWRDTVAMAAVDGRSATSSTDALFSAHRAVAARLERAAKETGTLERAERLEEAFERCVALARETGVAGGKGRTMPARHKDLAYQATSLAAELTKLVGRNDAIHTGDASRDALTSIADALLELSAGALETEPDKSLASVAALARLLEKASAEGEKNASAARGRLETGEAAEGILEELVRGATAVKTDEVILLSRQLHLALSEEIDSVKSLQYADLETVTELRAVRDLVESLAADALDARGENPASSHAQVDPAEVLVAYRATAPSRRVGRVLQEVDRIAGAEEDLAWKLRRARTWNYRALRGLAREQREIRRALQSAQAVLEPVRKMTLSWQREPQAEFNAALASISEAIRSMEEIFGLLTADSAERSSAGALTSAESLVAATGAARHCARILDDTVIGLEALRATQLEEARRARAWLQSQIESLPQRIARIAEKERQHAMGVRDLSTRAERPGARAHTREFLAAHEEIRRETESLAARVHGEHPALPDSSTPEAVAIRLTAVASGEMLEASRLLRSSTLRAGDGAAPLSRSGLLLQAASEEEKAAEKLGRIARALAVVHANEALRGTEKDLEDLLARNQPEDDALRTPEEVAKESRLYLDATLHAAATLSARLGADLRMAAILELLRAAAALFKEAIRLVEANELAEAQTALSKGLGRLEEAVTLSRKLRGELEGDLAEAEEIFEGKEDPSRDHGDKGEVARGLQATYAELEKIRAMKALEQDIAARLEELLREGKPDPEKRAELAKIQEKLAERLEDNVVSIEELVELVSKLVLLDRDAREIASLERTLAAETERELRLDGAADRSGLVRKQRDALERAEKLAKEFQTSGHKLSALLPQVLEAYWKAGSALELVLKAMEDGERELSVGSEPQKEILGAAERMDVFLTRIRRLRRQALEAIADQERGESAASSAQVSLQRARQSLEEAAEFLRSGDERRASQAQNASRRSLADAAQALHSRMAQQLRATGEEGFLASRVLDESATRLGLGWRILTRGSYLPEGTELAEMSEEMAFPAQFRELVRVYLRALEEKE